MAKFKVGDVVITRKFESYKGTDTLLSYSSSMNQYDGKVGKIDEITSRGNYTVHGWDWPESHVELHMPFKAGDMVVISASASDSPGFVHSMNAYLGKTAKIDRVGDRGYCEIHTWWWHPSALTLASKETAKPESKYKVGDTVTTLCFKDDKEAARVVGWSSRMDPYHNKSGRISSINTHGHVYVHGYYWPVTHVTRGDGPVSEAPKHAFKEGDVVTTRSFENDPILATKIGWIHTMAKYHGESGRISNVSEAGNVRVHGYYWPASYVSLTPLKSEEVKCKFKVGDRVTTTRHPDDGGYVSDMDKYAGKGGEITEVYRDRCFVHGWWWHEKSCSLVAESIPKVATPVKPIPKFKEGDEVIPSKFNGKTGPYACLGWGDGDMDRYVGGKYKITRVRATDYSFPCYMVCGYTWPEEALTLASSTTPAAATTAMFSAEAKPVVSQFKKGDYIVILAGSPQSHLTGYIFKQRRDYGYLSVEKDLSGSTNGWTNILPSGSYWRYAAPHEVDAYNAFNKPLKCEHALPTKDDYTATSGTVKFSDARPASLDQIEEAMLDGTILKHLGVRVGEVISDRILDRWDSLEGHTNYYCGGWRKSNGGWRGSRTVSRIHKKDGHWMISFRENGDGMGLKLEGFDRFRKEYDHSVNPGLAVHHKHELDPAFAATAKRMISESMFGSTTRHATSEIHRELPNTPFYQKLVL